MRDRGRRRRRPLRPAVPRARHLEAAAAHCEDSNPECDPGERAPRRLKTPEPADSTQTEAAAPQPPLSTRGSFRRRPGAGSLSAIATAGSSALGTGAGGRGPTSSAFRAARRRRPRLLASARGSGRAGLRTVRSRGEEGGAVPWPPPGDLGTWYSHIRDDTDFIQPKKRSDFLPDLLPGKAKGLGRVAALPQSEVGLGGPGWRSCPQ